jgi:hypothetical protein
MANLWQSVFSDKLILTHMAKKYLDTAPKVAFRLAVQSIVLTCPKTYSSPRAPPNFEPRTCDTKK